MTGYYDYLIILSPAEGIINQVKELKEDSFALIGDFEGRLSKASICVQQWSRKKPVWIEPMIPKLERDLQTLPPIILDINGFDFFDQQETKTIYARLQSSPATEVWFKQLRMYFNKVKFVPHIPIVKCLSPEAHQILWPNFKDLQWDAKFKISKLTILRRETIGYDKTYKLFKEIPFNTRIDFYEFTNAKLRRPPVTVTRVSSQQFSLF